MSELPDSQLPSDSPANGDAGASGSAKSAGASGPSGAGNPPPAVPTKSVPPKPAPKKRRRWLVIAVVAIGIIGILLVGVVAALVALVPTIASSGYARSIIVGQVNNNLNGKVSIDDISVSWTGGLKITGVRVLDESGAQILQLSQASTGLSLLDTIESGFKRFHLGDVVVDGLNFDAKRYKDGSTNFQRLLKSSASTTAAPPTAPTPATPEHSTKPITLPDVSGTIVLSNSSGTFEDESANKTVKLPNIAARIEIPSLTEPITQSFDLAAVGPDDKPFNLHETLNLALNATAPANNPLAIIKSAKLSAPNIDLPSLQAMANSLLPQAPVVVADQSAPAPVSLSSTAAASASASSGAAAATTSNPFVVNPQL